MRTLLARFNRVLAENLRSSAPGKVIPASHTTASPAMVEMLEERRLMSTFYVSPSGSDSNSGTSTSAPWRSISKVNSKDLNAGDVVLFKGGSTFHGTLSLTSGDGGTSSAPVRVGSYGTGKATISVSSGRGIVVSTGGVSIDNIKVIATSRSATYGIKVASSSGTKSYIRINNVDVSGFGEYGINIVGESGSAGFSDVRITNSAVYNNLDAGLKFHQDDNTDTLVHRNVYVGNVKAYNNPGDGHSETTGSGIELANVDGGIVERSLAWNNGANGNGGVGIWAHHANKITFRYNESWSNHTKAYRDGGGFNFDVNTRNSLMENNYAHDNDGHGFQLNQWKNNTMFTGNVIRYNIAQNNGRRNGYSGIAVWGRVLNSSVYNNTIYQGQYSGTNRALRVHNSGAGGLYASNVAIRNNIVIARNGALLVEVPSAMLSGSRGIYFQGNAYWTYGSTFKISYGGSTYSSPSSWRSARGQEKVGGTSVGFQLDPKLVNAGGGWTVANAYSLGSMNAYQLQSTSPLRGKGLVFSTSTAFTSSLSTSTSPDVGAGLL